MWKLATCYLMLTLTLPSSAWAGSTRDNDINRIENSAEVQVTEIKDPSSLEWLLIGAAIVLVTILIVRH